MSRARERGDGGRVRHRRRLDRGGGAGARARSTPIPAGLPGQRQRGRAALAGRRAGRSARRPGARRRRRRRRPGRAGWPPSAGCARSAPSRWRAGRARRPAGCSGCPSVVALSQALPFADGAFDAAWCLGVLCTTADKAGAAGRAAPGARRRRPARPAGLRRRRAPASAPARGQQLPDVGRGRAGCSPRPASGSPRRPTPTWPTAPPTGRPEPAPSTPRWSAGTATTRRGPRPQEQSGRVGRLLGSGALRPRLISAVTA